METIGAYEAKTHLPRLLEEVASGRSLVITRHGVPVARLVPAVAATTNPAEVVEALRSARKGARLGRLTIRTMIREGRR